MKISKLLLFAFFNLLSIHFVVAQDIDFNEGTVSIDGQQVFSYERNFRETLLYTLESNELVLHILNLDNRQTDRLNFLAQGIRVETSIFCGQTHRGVLKKLIERKILDDQGNVNTEELQLFYKLYNEECSGFISQKFEDDDDQ